MPVMFLICVHKCVDTLQPVHSKPPMRRIRAQCLHQSSLWYNDLRVECFKGSTANRYHESYPYFIFCITHQQRMCLRVSPASSLCNEGNPLVPSSVSTLWQSLKATVQLPVNTELSWTKAADLSSLTFPISSPDISLHLPCRSWLRGWCINLAMVDVCSN